MSAEDSPSCLLRLRLTSSSSWIALFKVFAFSLVGRVFVFVFSCSNGLLTSLLCLNSYGPDNDAARHSRSKLSFSLAYTLRVMFALSATRGFLRTHCQILVNGRGRPSALRRPTIGPSGNCTPAGGPVAVGVGNGRFHSGSRFVQDARIRRHHAERERAVGRCGEAHRLDYAGDRRHRIDRVKRELRVRGELAVGIQNRSR